MLKLNASWSCQDLTPMLQCAKAMARHYLNQVAATWDRLDPCIAEPKMSRHSELRSFQILKHRLWTPRTFRNLQQFREPRCFMVSVCNDGFSDQRRVFTSIHPWVVAPKTQASQQVCGSLSAEDFQDNWDLLHGQVIHSLNMEIEIRETLEIHGNPGVPEQFKRMVNGQGSRLPSSPLRERELMELMHV